MMRRIKNPVKDYSKPKPAPEPEPPSYRQEYEAMIDQIGRFMNRSMQQVFHSR